MSPGLTFDSPWPSFFGMGGPSAFGESPLHNWFHEMFWFVLTNPSPPFSLALSLHTHTPLISTTYIIEIARASMISPECGTMLYFNVSVSGSPGCIPGGWRVMLILTCHLYSLFPPPTHTQGILKHWLLKVTLVNPLEKNYNARRNHRT
jgi:hypothetical protein